MDVLVLTKTISAHKRRVRLHHFFLFHCLYLLSGSEEYKMILFQVLRPLWSFGENRAPAKFPALHFQELFSVVFRLFYSV